MNLKINFSIIFFFLLSLSSYSNSILERCWQIQGEPLTESYVSFKITETENYFSHSMSPWEQQQYQIKTIFDFNNQSYYKTDSLTTSRARIYTSKTQFETEHLLFIDYGEETLHEITESLVVRKLMHSCRYTPSLILNHFYQNKDNLKVENKGDLIVFETEIAPYFVKLFIDKKTFEIKKISTVSDQEFDDESYGNGDVEDVYYYLNYKDVQNFLIPYEIQVHKLNSKLQDLVLITAVDFKIEVKKLLDRPLVYTVNKEKTYEPDITIEKYSNQISFINLHHCGTRSMLVEFEDFILVAESPLNSQEGELLLQEVKKIVPNKPIKYFVFGHFHPHYTGGIRPFIHAGAKVICTEEDRSYIEYLASSLHQIKQDQLQKEPKQVEYEHVYHQKEIGDDDFKMIIYHIGSQSNHTNDYLIYYFPNEKMIFQDDLIRISKNTTKENVSKTTLGFYEAVKELDLDVIDIVQNWNVFDKNNKMMFKMEQLEQIMK